MQRRAFLQTVTGGIAVSAAPGQDRQQASPSPAPAAFELDELTIADLSRGLAAGRWTARRLVELYRSRIEALDREGPTLGAVIEMNPDALEIADTLDRERRDKHIRGPLHGIPLLLKDNIETADRMSTTAGSLALAGWHSSHDAFIAARLRAAGAVILGKTNLSEWANFRSTHSISGWSGRGGQTHNPYALRRNPSGSSSGSAAAVASNLCAAAVGSETDGSIVSPSSICGVVGLKPTLGLLSRAGIIPISHSQDTAGPIARTVRDAAILLSALTGVDERDPATALSSGKTHADYTKFLDPDGLRGARIGIARKFFEDNSRMDHFLDGCIDALRRAGATVVDRADLPSHGQWNDPEFQVLLYEFKTDLNAWLAKLPSNRGERTLKDLIAFNQQHRDREMPFFEQEIFELAEAKGSLADPKYASARRNCLRFTREGGIDAVIKQHKLDAIATLTSGPAWLIDRIDGDMNVASCSSPPAIAGYPHVTVPAGFYEGLPIGLSFFAGAWSEPMLLRLAFAFESATKARRAPTFADIA